MRIKRRDKSNPDALMVPVNSVTVHVGREGERGATWKEVSRRMGIHHGQASGALSTAHKKGWLARLEDKREGCSVYVTTEHVGDRAVIEYGRRAGDPRVCCPNCGERFIP